MNKQFLTGALTLSTLAIGVVVQASSAQAITFGFNNISGGDTVGDTYNTSFSLDVTDAGGGQVLFKLANNLAIPAGNFVSAVYFDVQNSLLSGMQLNQGNTGTYVNFDPTSQNLPQGGNLNPPFSSNFGGARVTGGSINAGNAAGIQYSEALGITFTGNFNNVIAALNNGNINVGFHLQGLGSGQSDSYVTYVPSTPIPTPALLPGAIGMGIAALRKKKRQQGLEEAVQEA